MPIPISEIEANPPWLQYGAFGLVCLIVIWFIKVIIPQYIMAMKAVSENFTAELREQRLAHAKERFEDRSDFKKFMSLRLVAFRPGRLPQLAVPLVQVADAAGHVLRDHEPPEERNVAGRRRRPARRHFHRPRCAAQQSARQAVQGVLDPLRRHLDAGRAGDRLRRPDRQ